MDIISLLIYAHRTDSYHKEIQLLLVKEYLKLFFFLHKYNLRWFH